MVESYLFSPTSESELSRWLMSINRSEKIMQYFHCNDNDMNLPKIDPNHDKLFKVRPVLDSLLEKCKRNST